MKEGLVLIDSVAINGSDLEKEGTDASSVFNILLSWIQLLKKKKQLNKPKDTLQPPMIEFYSQDEASKALASKIDSFSDSCAQ